MSDIDLLAKKLFPNSQDCVRIIQITDTHLFGEPKGKLLGLDTRESLGAVMSRVRQEEIAPDIILVTGDLSQDASPESYEYLLKELQAFNIPSFWIPGNHDDPSIMSPILEGDNVYPQRRVLIGDWQIVLLDSSVRGKVYGHISEPQLEFLKNCLEQTDDKHSLIAMHHQPVKVGSDWLDNLGIRNADELFEAAANHHNHCCFLWGHVHQDFHGEKNGIELISTPSTCVQFKPGSQKFSAGDESPGYRYLTLHKDGTIDSVLHRITDVEFTVDYSIKGY
ncbi:MAG: 3',5'-cyclic-AMP phosphodiesterase [Gammaproteobacteria bacterium]|nr:3',5'-cyclic-AMP phosphodiesterase [Gammaproteobacteria bacterium]